MTQLSSIIKNFNSMPEVALENDTKSTAASKDGKVTF